MAERDGSLSNRQNQQRGRFSIRGLGGARIVFVLHMPARTNAAPVTGRTTEFGYRSLYFPGVSDLAEAEVLTLVPGQRAEADLTLKREVFYPVSIAIANSSQQNTPIQIHDTSGRVITPRNARLKPGIPNKSVFLAAATTPKYERGTSTGGWRLLWLTLPLAA